MYSTTSLYKRVINMTTLSATELKNRLGEFLEKAQREPVKVTKGGRDYAVILSQEEYERFEALEDEHWARKAVEAQKSGYLNHEESMAELAQQADRLGIPIK